MRPCSLRPLLPHLITLQSPLPPRQPPSSNSICPQPYGLSWQQKPPSSLSKSSCRHSWNLFDGRSASYTTRTPASWPKAGAGVEGAEARMGVGVGVQLLGGGCTALAIDHHAHHRGNSKLDARRFFTSWPRYVARRIVRMLGIASQSYRGGGGKSCTCLPPAMDQHDTT